MTPRKPLPSQLLSSRLMYKAMHDKVVESWLPVVLSKLFQMALGDYYYYYYYYYYSSTVAALLLVRGEGESGGDFCNGKGTAWQ